MVDGLGGGWGDVVVFMSGFCGFPFFLLFFYFLVCVWRQMSIVVGLWTVGLKTAMSLLLRGPGVGVLCPSVLLYNVVHRSPGLIFSFSFSFF